MTSYGQSRWSSADLHCRQMLDRVYFKLEMVNFENVHWSEERVIAYEVAQILLLGRRHLYGVVHIHWL